MITENLKQLVKEEADKLRQYATKKELDRLDFDEFEPSAFDACIYGLMTGSCHSDRAINLLNNCSIPYSGRIIEFEKPIGGFSYTRAERYAFSPIEFYISLKGAKNANLIAYLKGETQTLDL